MSGDWGGDVRHREIDAETSDEIADNSSVQLFGFGADERPVGAAGTTPSFGSARALDEAPPTSWSSMP
ncbi:MAG TPA: hypothetical protein VMJ65_23410 [Solirubrobacteraceae bacterium]|nr:hypothetical protein [Solirubrobacteraceae bacterium]